MAIDTQKETENFVYRESRKCWAPEKTWVL